MGTIICDIDSTLCDHWVRIRNNTVPRWPGGTIHSRAFTKSEVLKDHCLTGCKQVLRVLETEGWNIEYLTARGWPNAHMITVEQLTQWDLPNPTKITICKNMAEKPDILKGRRDCKYYIDDFMTGQENNIGTFHHGIAKAIQSLGINVIVFRNDWFDVHDQIELMKGE